MTVAVGFCHGDAVTHEWRRSYTAVLVRDAAGARRIVGEFDHTTSGAHIATARSKIVREFLAHPLEPEWLWMCDTDATFADDVLDRLLATADPVERPIVGALSFGISPTSEPNSVGGAPIGLFPTLYFFQEGKTLRMHDYPRNESVAVHATGCHCILIHRSVLEDERWDTTHPLPWFRGGTVLNGGEVSEDVFFCIKAGAMGYPIHVDTSIKTGHVKTFIADEDAYLATRPSVQPQILLIVPSRARPQNARDLIDSWQATTEGLSRLVFCLDDNDPTATEYPEDANVVIGPPAQLVEWTNRIALANAGDFPVLASIGDDHRFGSLNWETAILEAIANGAGIVYGDDGIQHERLPTACFVSSQIVSALGYMAPPTITHMYADNFWLTLGRQAGCIRYLPDVKTPHLHPVAGLAPLDDSYRASNAPEAYERDRIAFEKWLQDDSAADIAKVRALRKVAV